MDITVITPFYKGNTYMKGLFSCISRNAQTAPALQIELILVNDSPDCPIIYEEDWIHGFSLHIINNTANSGIHCSRANGLAAAKGTFIQFLDQDDLLADETFLTQYAQTKSADVIIANGYDQNPNNPGPIYKSLAHQKQATTPRFYYSVGNQIVSPGHCLIRKSAIPAAWCESCISRNGSDDLLLWLMMFHENARFTINPKQLYTHVDTGENVSANTEKMLASSAEVLQILKKYNLTTAAEERRFLRSRMMAGAYVGKNKLQKILAMIIFPDIAKERLVLQWFKKR